MKKAKTKIESYEAAMNELQEIVSQLQEEAVNMDDLSGNVKRAAELIKYCKQKLRSTEEEIGEVFGD